MQLLSKVKYLCCGGVMLLPLFVIQRKGTDTMRKEVIKLNFKKKAGHVVVTSPGASFRFEISQRGRNFMNELRLALRSIAGCRRDLKGVKRLLKNKPASGHTAKVETNAFSIVLAN